ncbi:MAG: NAD(P)-dependent oxidoreductase [Sterolibacteriaceae bacterium]|nr:NAD(P)-dependent oxidoreductase [Candidatus Methylophosphatis haderslevensis]
MEAGFVGLGIMGRPMALNLLRAGHRLRVWSRRAESMRPLIDAGAIACDSAAQAAQGAQVVFSMVADAPDVKQVALGERGVADGAARGCVFVDMSTIAPGAARSIAARLAERGIDMLDAPVSGGEAGAISGSLTIMVGGNSNAFERVRPLFECLGKSITLIGDSGAGQVAKACNQVVTGISVAVIAEAFNYARVNGVDGERVREALLGGFAASRILDNHGGRMLARNFKPGFKAWMHQKDLRIVLDEAHRLGIALPAAAATAQLFNAMSGSSLGEDDSIGVLKLYERLSGGVGP